MDDSDQNPDEIQVRLKPILGLRPAVYVPAFYAVALVAILFAVLVLPGIRSHGTLLTVRSTPPGAAVRVDGNYVGSTPGAFFVPSGTRELEIERPHFAAYRETMNVRGRVIGSWFAPRRAELAVALGLPGSGTDAERDSVDQLVVAAATEFAKWALAGEASGQYQFPPIARALWSDLRGVDPAGNAGVLPSFDAFVSFALPHVASEAQLADLASAVLTSGGKAGVLVPAGVVYAAQRLASTAAEAPLMPLHVQEVLASGSAAAIRGSEWAASGERALLRARADATEPASRTGGVVRVATLGLDFVLFTPEPSSSAGGVLLDPGARGARGGDIPIRADLAPFAVSRTEVPARLLLEFIETVPEWSPANRAALIDAGLVDADYLVDIDRMRANPELPASGISAYAADAFVGWLNGRLPAGQTVRLPTEAEWEYVRIASAAQAGVFASTDGPVPVADAPSSRTGVVGLLGNVWELTSDRFARYARVYPDSPIDVGQRVVRGGGWANDERRFNPSDRGAVDPSWSSAFVGLRLVLVSGR
ncbi:MAG: PEGA domain-containing protein [Spirochaetaceae bacterium]|nr:MAG: PEGA domain-containing protein [Spirochaetaceae bacterium]